MKCERNSKVLSNKSTESKYQKYPNETRTAGCTSMRTAVEYSPHDKRDRETKLLVPSIDNQPNETTGFNTSAWCAENVTMVSQVVTLKWLVGLLSCLGTYDDGGTVRRTFGPLAQATTGATWSR